MMGKQLRIVALVALMALASSVVPGCRSRGSAGGAAPASARFQDQGGAQAEYREALGRLAFPPGQSASPTIPKPLEATSYEPGFGSALAERQWICAWERTWLQSSSTPTTKAAADDALVKLEGAKSTRFMSTQLDEAGRRLFDEYLTKAKLADPSGFQQDVEQNCAP